MKRIFMFPGQNSRDVGMMDRLQALTPLATGILSEASDTLGRNLSLHFQCDNPTMFARNRDVQIGVFLANFIFARALEAEGVHCDCSIGLSLGEYNHLVEIGALSFPAALRLLEARGQAYESAPDGVMISVFPCDEVQVQEALNREEANGLVDISIHLAKKHFVLGGKARAVESAAAWLEEEAFTQAHLIDARLPMHARIFKPVADAFRESLEFVEWQLPRLPYLSNTTGDFLEEPRSDDFVDRLYRHVFSTVQWTRSIETVLHRFPDAALVEVGPRAVLYNQVSREYRKIPAYRVDDETDLAANFRSVALKLAG